MCDNEHNLGQKSGNFAKSDDVEFAMVTTLTSFKTEEYHNKRLMLRQICELR